jgi:hypothetical protein
MRQLNIIFTALNRSETKLDAFHIYFDTATYDTIEKNEKVTFEDQLGVIGGTMGLLTGFSILSAVEIVFFVIKFFISLRFGRKSIRTP